MRFDLSPEDRLCLILARGQLPPPACEEARALLARPLQWDRVLEQARANEVYPMLYRNLRYLGFAGVPASVRAKLEALFRMNALRNTLLADELTLLLGALSEAGIPVIPLKGLFLAESLYGDLTLRVCVDMDLLVPRRNMTQALDLLVARGYQAEFSRWFLTDRGMQNSFECAVRKRERTLDYMVELHWGLFWESSWEEGSIKDLWGAAHETIFRGVPVSDLSPEWQVVFLLVHAARHHWQSLKWLVDIHELCLRGGIGWETVETQMRELGWEPFLRWGLSVSHVLLETPLPPGFVVEMPPSSIRLFPAPPRFPAPLQDLLLFLRLAKQPSEKVLFLLRRLLLPTPGDSQLCRLPTSLGFLYYLVRPLRMGYLLCSSLWGAGFRGKDSP